MMLWGWKKVVSDNNNDVSSGNLVQSQQSEGLQFSPVVQQALGKLNVRLADLMEQINIVIKVLVDENVELRAKIGQLQQSQKSEVKK
jgi:hypothetical protein